MRAHFLTSAFDQGFSAEFIAALKPCLPKDPSLVFVASDFSGHEKTEKYARQFLRWFQDQEILFSRWGIVDFTLPREEAVRAVEQADVVWLNGGDTLKQMAHIREYGLIPALRNRDGVTIGMSAGSINMARRVVLAKDESDNIPELSVYEGIGLVECNIEPHVNQAAPSHWKEIFEASRLAPIYCLHDGSFILEQEGKVRVFGRCETAFQGKLLSACGNDCASCPRHLPKSEEELQKTAELWHQIGYRDQVVSNEEIACSGCTEDTWCRYQIVRCAHERRISTCGECPQYPCGLFHECLRVTESFQPQCQRACGPDDYRAIAAAFFEKRQNLDAIHEWNAHR